MKSSKNSNRTGKNQDQVGFAHIAAERDRIQSNCTVTISKPGPNLVAAVQECYAEQHDESL